MPSSTATAVGVSPLTVTAELAVANTELLSTTVESAAEVLGQLLETTVGTGVLSPTVTSTNAMTATLYLPMIAVPHAPTQLEASAVATATDAALLSPLYPVPSIPAPAIFPGRLSQESVTKSAENIGESGPASADAEQPSSAAPTAVAPAPAQIRVQPTPDGTARTNQIPILMYHYLSTPPADADIYRTDLSVSPELFAAHLDAMRAAGYQTITLYDLLANLTRGTALPEKAVIITFDDGYRDNYTNAFPLLAERDMTATFFIVTDFIDDGLPAYVTWEMVREMYAAGMQIESHGRNHFSLQNRDQDFLVWQALGSAETIEYELGVRPRFVSYPAGEYDQLTMDIFHSAHYWAGVTTVQGASHSSDNLFELQRVRVRSTTDVDELMRLLELDW